MRWRLLVLALLLCLPSWAGATLNRPLQEGDAFSRVVCRADPKGGSSGHLKLIVDPEEEEAPKLWCELRSYRIVREDGRLIRKRIESFKPLKWEPWTPVEPLTEADLLLRRYFVAPELCFERGGTWRCQKFVHEKGNSFEIELPLECPYRVKIGAGAVVTTFVTDDTLPPLEASGTKLIGDRVTSNPFSFHPAFDVDGEYYCDLAIIDVECPPPPCLNGECCPDGTVNRESGETCDDGNFDNDDGCRNNCTFCGDGIIQPPEVCDPNHPLLGMDCDQNCKKPPIDCGDGILQPGEMCDPGGEDGPGVPPPAPNNPTNMCRAAGTTDECTYCGDGVEQGDEKCDDGNRIDNDGCNNECKPPRFCEMFRDPSFTRDQNGAPRLKANGRMTVLDLSVAPHDYDHDDNVVDIANERIEVRASTPEEGQVFSRTFHPGDLDPFRDGGNVGYEHGKGTNDEFKLKIKNDHTRFNLELPGDSRMDALLELVEAGSVTQRRVTFEIDFEETDITCQATTDWDCKATDNRGSCKGHLK